MEPTQALVETDVGKHRFDRSKALVVKLPATKRTNRWTHALTPVGIVFGFWLDVADLAPTSIVGFHGAAKALVAARSGIPPYGAHIGA